MPVELGNSGQAEEEVGELTKGNYAWAGDLKGGCAGRISSWVGECIVGCQVSSVEC